MKRELEIEQMKKKTLLQFSPLLQGYKPKFFNNHKGTKTQSFSFCRDKG